MADDSKSDDARRDQVLRRMLNTPPRPHKPIQKGGVSKAASKPHRKKVRASR